MHLGLRYLYVLLPKYSDLFSAIPFSSFNCSVHSFSSLWNVKTNHIYLKMFRTFEARGGARNGGYSESSARGNFGDDLSLSDQVIPIIGVQTLNQTSGLDI